MLLNPDGTLHSPRPFPDRCPVQFYQNLGEEGGEICLKAPQASPLCIRAEGPCPEPGEALFLGSFHVGKKATTLWTEGREGAAVPAGEERKGPNGPARPAVSLCAEQLSPQDGVGQPPLGCQTFYSLSQHP